MSSNAIEKQAQTLNQALRTKGKLLGKNWRLRIRDLLNQTFNALNAKPLDGALCLRLQQQIESELTALENDTVDKDTLPEVLPKKQVESKDKSERMAAGHSEHAARMAESQSGAGEPRMAESQSGAGATAPLQTKDTNAVKDESKSKEKPEKPKDESIGLFDLIHIHIRTFFTIRACVRPPYIGKFVQFADKHAETVQERIDKFLNVLSKGDDKVVGKTGVEVGYREDLLPDMPDRNLVLAPKKKKRR